MRRVVITGVGMVSAIGNNVKDSWHAALHANSGVDFIKHFDTAEHRVKVAAEVKNFDASSVIDPKNLRRISRFVQFATVATHEAVADSGVDIASQADRVGCAIGVARLACGKTSQLLPRC